MLILSFAFLVIVLWVGYCEEQYCSIDGGQDCVEKETNVYKKDLNEQYTKYHDAIKEAEKNDKPCNNTNNGCFKDVIERDLKPFREKGIDKDLINTAKNRGTYYQIVRGKVYRQKDCMFPSRCAGIEHFLLKLAPDLPDMDLVINTRDYPQSSKHFGGPLPIFSFSKTPQYYDITYPAWAFWEGGPAISLYPRGLGRWDEHRESLEKASRNAPWEDKEDKGFFRGSRTSSERDSLILLSRSNPDLVDARYTKNQAWKSDKFESGMRCVGMSQQKYCGIYTELLDRGKVIQKISVRIHEEKFTKVLCTYLRKSADQMYRKKLFRIMPPTTYFKVIEIGDGHANRQVYHFLFQDTLYAPPASEVPLESHCKYKYLFNYRGVAASFRHKHLFLCRSLVFHVGDEWNEFYYDAMVPWVHYIPVSKDANQTALRVLIRFAKANDDISKKIADRGRDFIWNNLRIFDLMQFWRKLMKRYSKLLLYKTTLDKSLMEIERKGKS